MTEQDKPQRIPIRASNGDIIGMITIDGVQFWSRRKREWETYTVSWLVEQHEQLLLMSESAILFEKQESTG